MQLSLHCVLLWFVILYQSGMLQWYHDNYAFAPVLVKQPWSIRINQVNSLNTLKLLQNGRHFAGDLFKRIFLNETARISIKISLVYQISNIPALVHIMAWRRPGDKPLSEPMMAWLPTHICVNRPQWVKTGYLNMTKYDKTVSFLMGYTCTVHRMFHVRLIGTSPWRCLTR